MNLENKTEIYNLRRHIPYRSYHKYFLLNRYTQYFFRTNRNADIYRLF